MSPNYENTLNKKKILKKKSKQPRSGQIKNIIQKNS
jgi:hypothetical protein